MDNRAIIRAFLVEGNLTERQSIIARRFIAAHALRTGIVSTIEAADEGEYMLGMSPSEIITFAEEVLPYEIRDGQLEPDGCYDNSVDAVIFKDENRGQGPVWIRRQGEKEYQGWYQIEKAQELASFHNLPFGVV